jgi:type IV secretory system conjugative DNA transfer VirD4/TraG family protein
MNRLRRRTKTAAPLPWEWLRGEHPSAAGVLDALHNDRTMADIDRARILTALDTAAADVVFRDGFARDLVAKGPAAVAHPSGLRTLPGRRFAMHNVLGGQVRLGRVVPTANSDLMPATDFGVDHDVLRTSLMVIGPPGSGKTRGLAIPIVEHLSLSALAGRASLVVVDPKGTDFAYDGWFDVTIDPLNPTHGFSLFGGASDADTAADRLASALMPPKVSDDKAYFVDASNNALYDCLAPFHAAFERWPTIRQLLGLLRAAQQSHDEVKAALKGKPNAREWKDRLDARVRQSQGSHDPAASLVERFARLDRPALRGIFDHRRQFQMRDINKPTRVRIAVPESEYPEASRILARLVVSQFVQTTSAADTNRRIFKGLIIDEAGRYVDDYVARGTQKLRSTNAGLVLLAQTLADFPPDVQPTIFGSTGCKAVFGGVDPATAEHFSTWFGEHWITDSTVSRGQTSSVHYDYGRILPTGHHDGRSRSVSSRRVERARWTASNIITGVPIGHSLISLARSDGHRVGPVLVNLRD